MRGQLSLASSAGCSCSVCRVGFVSASRNTLAVVHIRCLGRWNLSAMIVATLLRCENSRPFLSSNPLSLWSSHRKLGLQHPEQRQG